MLDHIITCTFEDNHLVVPSSVTDSQKELMYRFIQQAVLDAHIPVSKASGFRLGTITSIQRMSAIERCSCCLENMVSIASNLDDKIFLNVSNNRAVTDSYFGEIRADKTRFLSNSKQVELLYLDPYIATSIKELSLDIFVAEQCGYRTMEDNSSLMNQSKFFPMNSYHTLMEHVRVLPYNGEIRYRLGPGMDKDKLRDFFFNYLLKVKASVLCEEELRWVYSFQQ